MTEQKMQGPPQPHPTAKAIAEVFSDGFLQFLGGLHHDKHQIG